LVVVHLQNSQHCTFDHGTIQPARKESNMPADKLRQDTIPQNQPEDRQDRAENEMDRHAPSRWESAKRDIHGEQRIANSALSSDGLAGEALEEPSWEPHSIQAQFPAELQALRLTEPQGYAAGVPAVIRSIEHFGLNKSILHGSRTLMVLNQSHGIDCMSCAWPEPDGHRRMAEFCENGAKAVAWETDSRKCDPEFFAKYSVEELSNRHEYWLGQQGRLTHPMVLREGATHYEPISWSDAYGMIAEELKSLDSPDEAIFYTSGRASNESAFLYGVFARHFGTNNMPDCSNMCHESSGAALAESIGIGKGTATIEDYAKAQVILIVGHNPATNHPRMLSTLAEAKQNGAKIIVINPLIEGGLLRFKDPQTVKGVLEGGQKLADIYLHVRINGDIPLFKGIMYEMLAIEDASPGNAFDWKFIREKTAGLDDFLAALRQQDMDVLAAQSGISREQMREVAELLVSSERIIASWCLGLTQQKTAVHAIQELVNLILLRGSIGKPGCGVSPVRGHSNVQGDRTMGVWERPRAELLNQLQACFGFEPPRHHGFDTVESIKAMHAGKAKVFVSLCGNFLSAAPDTEYTAESLRNTRLTVQISTKLNRSHLVTGKKALILPALGRTERDVQKSGEQFQSTENSMGVVEMSRGRLEPASPHLMSEPAMICNIAARTLGEQSKVDWLALADNYDRIRDLIAKVIPGCDGYNQKVRQKHGFYLPNKPRQGNFENTHSGKANFQVVELPEHKLEPGQLVLTTVRSHDQFNTTIYSWNDVYRGVHNERRILFMNTDDMRERGLVEGDIVNLTSHFKGQKRYAQRFVVVPYRLPRGNTAGYFPEMNVLLPINSVADKSNQPTAKYIVITADKANEPRVPLEATWADRLIPGSFAP
jgi:molybdopterin-dependent oxidoreductase alpha subunit